MMDGLPSYFRDVLGFSITTAGLLAALPQLLVIVTTLGSSWLADALSARTLSVGATRRLFSALGLAPSTLLLGLIGLGYISEPSAAVVALTVIQGAMGCSQGGGCKIHANDPTRSAWWRCCRPVT